jgi:hypothetical protein
METSINSQTEPSTSDPSWAVRIPAELRDKILATCEQTKTKQKDLMIQLWSLYEADQKKAEIEQIPAVASIQNALRKISQLAENSIMEKVGIISNLGADLQLERQQHKEREGEQQRKLSEMESIIKTMNEQSSDNKISTEALMVKLSQSEEEKKSLIKISSNAQNTLEDAKHRMAGHDHLESQIKMTNLQLSSANSEKDRLKTILDESIERHAIEKNEDREKFESQKKEDQERYELKLEKALFSQKVEADKELNILRTKISTIEAAHNEKVRELIEENQAFRKSYQNEIDKLRLDYSQRISDRSKAEELSTNMT